MIGRGGKNRKERKKPIDINEIVFFPLHFSFY
jgi:hypothetical protein